MKGCVLSMFCLVLLVHTGCGEKKPEAEKPPATPSSPAKPATPPQPAPTPEPPKPSFTIEARGNDKRPMAKVPQGPFLRGSKKGEGLEEEEPQKTITLKEFWIDQNEVTVSDWQACLAAGGCRKGTFREARVSKKKTKKKRPVSCNFGLEDRKDHPMNCVQWHGAAQYCKWAGKRLPTEAEWEKAARGSKGQLYPWGNDEADCSKACMIKNSMFGCGARTTCKAGSKEAGTSPYGVRDMAGNVYEWVADGYSKDYYTKAKDVDPFNKARTKDRPVRGGSYSSDGKGVRAAQRSGFASTSEISFIGFRCAMD